jgi:hypothetical protein
VEEQINQIRQAMATITEFLTQQGIENFSDEAKYAVTQFLGTALDRIQQLEQGVTPPIPDMPQAEIPSSNIDAFRYDDKSGRLFVKFLGKFPNRQGPVYSYSGIPKPIVDLFQRGAIPARTDGQNKWGKWWKGKVPSLGASLYTLIKTANYPYTRMS